MSEVYRPGRCVGLIVDSGIASAKTLPLFGESKLLDLPFCENLSKMAELRLPTLVLHGSADKLIPLDQGEALHAASGGGAHKRLAVIRGHGHNDLSWAEDYWRSLAAFLDVALPGR